MYKSPERVRAMFAWILCAVLLLSFSAVHAEKFAGIGRKATNNEVAAWDIDVRPDFQGLPRGSGSVAQGEKIWVAKCASCHGNQGQGGVANRLVGGGALNTDKPIKTVGSYWPYATTVFDYTKRAMPHPLPQSLTNDEVYATTAYILYMNKIIGIDDEMNAKTLPLVKMPNWDGFIPVLR